MNKLLLLFSFCLLVIWAQASQVVPMGFQNGGNAATRYEVTAYSETFESGAPGWTHYDGAISPNNWHIYNYGGTQGNCWWMGDPALASGAGIGGYHNHQYLVLDTPARNLTTANSTLTFKLRYNVENPSGAEAPYSGWDACNVRISVNGGAWTPISGAPAYNVTSAYSFGFEHGEGPNIPGWGGVLDSWTTATFNLGSYVGQSVRIRFAFGSDPAYDTSDAPGMFGMMVDDIAFGGYSNNGVSDGQMTWSSLVPMGGDIWNIATDAAAPSPTHVMRNQNASGTYNPNMLNYLVSPSITLPVDGEIRCDFMIKGLFTDPDTFPEVDYFGWEISPDNGTTWNAMSNPYADPAGSNYVYSDAPPDWAAMTESYTLDGIITNFHGQTVKFRWYFQSDADAPSGTGIMIDDFKIYNDIVVAPPEDLEAVVNGDTVTLNWDAPGSGGGGGEEGWIHYDGENNDSIGTGAAADFDVAAKWDAVGAVNSIYPYVGMNITKIQVWPNEANCSYAVRIWTSASNTLVVDQAFTPTIDQWNEIVLTTPFTIPAGTQIMAGYRCNTSTGYPAGCDAGPQVEGYGNMMRYEGVWTTLYALASTLTYNWNIRVYVQDATGREYVLGELPQNDQFATGTLAASGIANSTRDRDVTAYRIYRDGAQIGVVAGTTLTYTDENVPGGIHSYGVTAVYGSNESNASNTISVFVLPSLHAELFHDDGTPEQGYNVGSTKHMGIGYNYGGSVIVKWAKVYVHTPGTAGIIIRVFDNDGASGMPGTQLAQYQYPATSVVQGWNYIALPTPIEVTDGSFYLAILETVNAAQIGLDTSSNGYSVKKINSNWELVTQGEVMIRAIVQINQSDPFGNATILPTSMTVVAGVTINGVQAAAGDVLAAFVNVSGEPQLRGKQTIQVVDGIAGCILQIYTTNNGESAYFKVWDMSGNEVLNCDNSLLTVVNGTVGSWPSDLYMINASTATTQSIALVTGWNLVSLNVSPTSHAISTLISAIGAQVQQIKGVEGVYIPNNPYSTLVNLSDGRAYNFLMSAPATWNVTGMAIAPTTPISLTDGWNMAAYLPQTSMQVTEAMASISSWLQQVKGTDGVYIPNNPYSTLTSMYPGKGYWIKINGAHNLIYPGRSDTQDKSVPRVDITREVETLSNSMVILVKCESAQAGDLVIAKVKGVVRGKEVLISPEGFPAALVQVYCEQTGEEVTFSLISKNGYELKCLESVTSDPGNTIGQYPEFLNLNLDDSNAWGSTVSVSALTSCHPNPFNPMISIGFSSKSASEPISISVYNLKGQKVSELTNKPYPSGLHSINWNGTSQDGHSVSSGVYFVLFESGSLRQCKKIILQK